MQEECDLHVFHPEVHPEYRLPPTEESLLRMEEEKKQKEEQEQLERENDQRRRRRLRMGLDPDAPSEITSIQEPSQSMPPSEHVFSQLMSEQPPSIEENLEHTRGAAVATGQLKFETISEQLKWE